jgi:hypothetical protein
MSGYAIMRFAKHHGSASGLEAHHERMKDSYESNPDIQTAKSSYNIHLIEPEGRYNREIKSRIEAAQQANPKCRVKQNSVRFVDTLITASPTFFYRRTREDVERYFKTALRFIEEKVSERNIVSAVIHMDEATPHLHLIFVPLTEDDRLSAKEIIGGPAGCRKWQDEFYQRMAKSFPDLLRGKSAELTGREHLPPKMFKAAASMERIDQKLNVYSELKKLREYVGGIPQHLKVEIAEHKKQEQIRKRGQERSRER